MSTEDLIQPSIETASLAEQVEGIIVEAPSGHIGECGRVPFHLNSRRNYISFRKECIPVNILLPSHTPNNLQLLRFIRYVIFNRFFPNTPNENNTIPVIGYRTIIAGTDRDIAVDALTQAFAEGRKVGNETWGQSMARRATAAGIAYTQTPSSTGLGLRKKAFAAKEFAFPSIKAPAKLPTDPKRLLSESITLNELKSIARSVHSLFLIVLLDTYCRVEYIRKNFCSYDYLKDRLAKDILSAGRESSEEKLERIRSLREYIKLQKDEKRPKTLEELDSDLHNYYFVDLHLKEEEPTIKTNAMCDLGLQEKGFLQTVALATGLQKIPARIVANYYRYYLDFNEIDLDFISTDKNFYRTRILLRNQNSYKKAIRILKDIFKFGFAVEKKADRQKRSVNFGDIVITEEGGNSYIELLTRKDDVKKLISEKKIVSERMIPYSPTILTPSLPNASLLGLNISSTGLQFEKGLVTSTGILPRVVDFMVRIARINQEDLNAILKGFIEGYKKRLKKEFILYIEKKGLVDTRMKTIIAGTAAVDVPEYVKMNAPSGAIINHRDLVEYFNISFIPRFQQAQLPSSDIPYAFLSMLAYEKEAKKELEIFEKDTPEGLKKPRYLHYLDILGSSLISKDGKRTIKTPFLQNDFVDSNGEENIRFYYEIPSDLTKELEKSPSDEELIEWLQMGVEKRGEPTTDDFRTASSTLPDELNHNVQHREKKKRVTHMFRLFIAFRGTHFGKQDLRDLYGADAFIVMGSTANDPRFSVCNRITANISSIFRLLKNDISRKGDALLPARQKRLILDNMKLVIYATGHSLGGTLAVMATYFSFRNPIPNKDRKNISPIVLSIGFNSGMGPQLMRQIKDLPEDTFRIYRIHGDIISYCSEFYKHILKNKENIISLPNVHSYHLEDTLQNHPITNFIGAANTVRILQLQGLSRKDFEGRIPAEGLSLYGEGTDPQMRLSGNDVIQQITFVYDKGKVVAEQRKTVKKKLEKFFTAKIKAKKTEEHARMSRAVKKMNRTAHPLTALLEQGRRRVPYDANSNYTYSNSNNNQDGGGKTRKQRRRSSIQTRKHI